MLRPRTKGVFGAWAGCVIALTPLDTFSSEFTSAFAHAVGNDRLAPLVFPADGAYTLFEAEQVPVAGEGWVFRQEVEGYAGTGYLAFFPDSNDQSTRPANTRYGHTYWFTVKEPGEYSFYYRNAAPEITEHNDAWVAFPDGGAYRVQGSQKVSLGTGAFKLYQNESGDRFVWTTQTVDFTPWRIRLEFPAAGIYRLQLFGRSTRLKVDRFAITRRPEPDWPGILDQKASVAAAGLRPVGTEATDLLLNVSPGDSLADGTPVYRLRLDDPESRDGIWEYWHNGQRFATAEAGSTDPAVIRLEEPGSHVVLGLLRKGTGVAALSEAMVLENQAAPRPVAWLIRSGNPSDTEAEHLIRGLLAESGYSVEWHDGLPEDSPGREAPDLICLAPGVTGEAAQAWAARREPLLALGSQTAQALEWIASAESAPPPNLPGEARLEPATPQFNASLLGPHRLSLEPVEVLLPVDPALRTGFLREGDGAVVLAWEAQTGPEGRERRVCVGMDATALRGLLTPGYRVLREVLRWIDRREAPLPWWQTLPNSPGGRRSSEWFGDLWQTSSAWLYHEDLGWIAGDGSPDPRAFWIYTLDLGWTYAGSALHPFVFSATRQAWYWVYRDFQPGDRAYHNLSTGLVETYP